MDILVSENTLKLNTAFNLLKESIDSGRLVEFEVISNSMLPLLRIDDKVIIDSIVPEKLKLGEIIVYKLQDFLYVHRYIYTLKKPGRPFSLVTKADNRFNFDPYLVPINQLLGKVVAIKRQDTKINLESFFWKRINFFIGILSFLEAFMIKVWRYFYKRLAAQ